MQTKYFGSVCIRVIRDTYCGNLEILFSHFPGKLLENLKSRDGREKRKKKYLLL